MSNIYKLHNQIKHYEWGCTHTLPDFLGGSTVDIKEGMPCAELWMGTHTGAPSQIENAYETGIKKNLSEVSGDLPFLFKLLAVDKPLSIQAHPDKEKAEQGFAQEEKDGISISSPKRNFKDTNHKPELVCALSTFTLMAGFRDEKRIYNSLEELSNLLPQLKEIISPLLRALNTDSLAVFFRMLFELTDLEKEYIGNLILEQKPVIFNKIISMEQWELIRAFASRYPLDSAILSPLYLNLITLEPFQAVYFPPGILHAYIKGFAVELMASSDNVLRGGLTPKYIDIPQLMNILNFSSYTPVVITPDLNARFTYPVDCNDFSLAFLKGGNEIIDINKHTICLVTEGELYVNDKKFIKGESFFVDKAEEKLSLNGDYSLFIAS